MTETSPHSRLASLGSEAPSSRFVAPAAVRPTGYAAPARFLPVSKTEEIDRLALLAAQLLQDPMAMQQLSDRVVELLQQDLKLQRERSHGYGRRW